MLSVVENAGDTISNKYLSLQLRPSLWYGREMHTACYSYHEWHPDKNKQKHKEESSTVRACWIKGEPVWEKVCYRWWFLSWILREEHLSPGKEHSWGKGFGRAWRTVLKPRVWQDVHPGYTKVSAEYLWHSYVLPKLHWSPKTYCPLFVVWL